MNDQKNKKVFFEKEIIRAKRANFIFLFLLMVSIVVAFYFYHLLREKNELLEIQNNQITEHKNRIVALLDSIDQFIELDMTVDAADQIQLKSLTDRLQNSKYSVGIVFYQVSDENQAKVNDYLNKEGYSITSRWKFDNYRPSWVALESKVFYYDTETSEKANQIADELGAITGVQFTASQGAGLGVIRGQEKWTIYVHYVVR